MAENEFAPVTPGEMLNEEFLAGYGLSQNRLAKAVGISPNRIADIVNNRRRITADTAFAPGLSDFVRRKALEAAEINVLERSVVTIPAKHWEAFESWIARPAKPIPALKRLARKTLTWQR